MIAGVYIVGEVDDGDTTVVCPYQSYMSGVLNYPALVLHFFRSRFATSTTESATRRILEETQLTLSSYYWITQAFESTTGSISNLVNGVNTMKSDCADTTLLGSFMENHDNPRFPSYTSDMSLAKNAIAFTILADGIPISKFTFSPSHACR